MQFIGIRSEGGLLPLEILEQIALEKLEGQKSSSFGLPANRKLTDEIARAWGDAQSHWNVFKRAIDNLPEKDSLGTTATREKWITRLLQDALGYELTYQPSGPVVNGRTYAISHRAGEGQDAPPVHIEGFKIDLDKRPESRRVSPHALVQEYLNNSEAHLWGVVANGLQLRLLRDTSRTSRPTYLEFNLQSILEGNNFNEFALFYRLCHRTRLPRTADDSANCLLETYHRISIEQGGRVRDHLRDGVEEALKILGTGFLRHPKNTEFCERAKSGKLSAQDLHRQLLRLVYRLLFLMVAEERRMILPEAPESERRWKIYQANYSVQRLRLLVEKHVEQSTFGDLWLGLKRTFKLFEDGDSNPLGIPPLNGDLFGYHAIEDLQPTHLYNDDLRQALRHLSLFRNENGALQRINYSALDVEELGSVYESLLDFQPVIENAQEGVRFDLRTGSERKSTGSYYTRPELVRELIESALVPVMEARISEARSKNKDKGTDALIEVQEQAILSITVCDPACGSGHFLLAAARRLGRELAKVRTGEEEPTPKEFHLAVRDVISHCIYGVDLNPLAVDLCKLAMWLEGHWTGKPLSFLDHRIKCGNSLIGVLDPKVLEEGVPDEAFTPVTGDDKEVAKALKKRNRDERKGQPSLPFEITQHVHDYASEYLKLTDIAEETPAGVRQKAKAYDNWRSRKDWWHDWTACNIWTAAFFVPITIDNPTIPTHDRLLRFKRHQDSQPQMAASANALGEQLKFFHWRLEFPEVFERGGFDVVIGNPPWEKTKLHEKEYWADDEYIVGAGLKAERVRRINEYRESADPLKRAKAARFDIAKHSVEATTKFLRGSSRFVLSAAGDMNTYALFTDLSIQIAHPAGRTGFLVPVGLVTDDTTKDLFGNLVREERLVRVIGFENESFIFPAVHHTFKFCALTTCGAGLSKAAEFAFFCRHFEDVLEKSRFFTLSVSDFELLSPNTLTCPTFRTSADADLCKKFYRHFNVFLNEEFRTNRWGVQFLSVFHMTNDSGLFHTSQLPNSISLYEAKMLHQFDHRWGTYEGATRAQLNVGTLPQPAESDKADTKFSVRPKYWVDTAEVEERLSAWNRNWFWGFRDITSAVAERTAIFSLLPRVGAGNTITALLSDRPSVQQCCLIANMNSLVTDYVVRNKLTYVHLSQFVLKQIAVIGPDEYQPGDFEFIVPRVLKLVCTSEDVMDLYRDSLTEASDSLRSLLTTLELGYFSGHRHVLRAELDAYFAHLYGLTRDELRYILDPKDVFGADFPSETFRVLKEREEKQFGEYRTSRLVLEAFDELARSSRFRDEMPKRVSALEVPKAKALQASPPIPVI